MGRDSAASSTASTVSPRPASLDASSDDADPQHLSSQALESFSRQSGSQPSSPTHRSDSDVLRSSEGSPHYSSDFSAASTPSVTTRLRRHHRVSFASSNASDSPRSAASSHLAGPIEVAALQTAYDRSASSSPTGQDGPTAATTLDHSTKDPSKSDSVFERLWRKPAPGRGRTPPPPPAGAGWPAAAGSAAGGAAARSAKPGPAKFRRDPRLAAPPLRDAMPLRELALLAMETAQLGELGNDQLDAVVIYLEALCFVHHFDAVRANPIQSVTQHLRQFATVQRLRQVPAAPERPTETERPGPASRPRQAPLDVAAAFSVVPWGAVADALETVETEPPLDSLAFLSRWLPAGLGLDPLYPVHHLLRKLTRHVALIRGDCLQRCLRACLTLPPGGRTYPPLYEVGVEPALHRALGRQLLRLLRGADSAAEFRAWRGRSGRAIRQQAAALARQADSQAMAQCAAAEVQERKELEGQAQFERWLSAKEVAQRAAVQERIWAAQRAKVEEAEAAARRDAEAQHARWRWKLHQAKADLHREAPPPPLSTAKRLAKEAQTEAMQEAAQRAYDEWLSNVNAKRAKEELLKHQRAIQERAEVKRRYKQDQRAFKQWLRQKARAPKQGECRARRPAWQPPAVGAPGCLVLAEQRYDYFY